MVEHDTLEYRCPSCQADRKARLRAVVQDVYSNGVVRVLVTATCQICGTFLDSGESYVRMAGTGADNE